MDGRKAGKAGWKLILSGIRTRQIDEKDRYVKLTVNGRTAFQGKG